MEKQKEELKNPELYRYVKCSKCSYAWKFSRSTPLNKILEMSCIKCGSESFCFVEPEKK
jgi:hypothetical protein